MADRKEGAVTEETRVESLLSEFEPLTNLHPEAGGDIADDGRRGADRHRCFSAIAYLGASSGRLPYHAGSDVLSWRESGSGDFFHHRAARKTVRSSAGADADDFDQFLWQLPDHPAVFTRSQHRHRGTGGAGCHQRGDYLSAHKPARASDL